MENSYKEFLKTKSKEELVQILMSTDKDKNPELYRLALESYDELQKESGQYGKAESFGSDYANVLTRFGAIVIDGLLSFLFYLPILISIRLFKNSGDLSTFVVISVISLLGMMMFGIWNSIVRMGKTGQSLGRKFLNIAVLNAEGLPIGVGRAALREIIGRMISGMFCYIGYLNAFWDKKKQMWHDKMANCYVYYVDEHFS